MEQITFTATYTTTNAMVVEFAKQNWRQEKVWQQKYQTVTTTIDWQETTQEQNIWQEEVINPISAEEFAKNLIKDYIARKLNTIVETKVYQETQKLQQEQINASLESIKTGLEVVTV